MVKLEAIIDKLEHISSKMDEVLKRIENLEKINLPQIIKEYPLYEVKPSEIYTQITPAITIREPSWTPIEYIVSDEGHLIQLN